MRDDLHGARDVVSDVAAVPQEVASGVIRYVRHQLIAQVPEAFGALVVYQVPPALRQRVHLQRVALRVHVAGAVVGEPQGRDGGLLSEVADQRPPRVAHAGGVEGVVVRARHPCREVELVRVAEEGLVRVPDEAPVVVDARRPAVRAPGAHPGNRRVQAPHALVPALVRVART